MRTVQKRERLSKGELFVLIMWGGNKEDIQEKRECH